MKSEDIFSWQNKYCVRITFISDNHRYHDTGEAAGLIEPLDERVGEFLKRLIRQGTKNAKELQRRAWNTLKKACFQENHIQMPLEGNFVQIARKLGTWFHP